MDFRSREERGVKCKLLICVGCLCGSNDNNALDFDIGDDCITFLIVLIAFCKCWEGFMVCKFCSNKAVTFLKFSFSFMYINLVKK